MATTTPNFGWPVPTSTDLVKDGAVAIETLGDAVDASLLDLKGGTTGQVLSKTSNTDMDFTWVAADDTNAIQNAIVDAKGDLIAASAADTPARLAVGANGTTLVADSSTATGLRYQDPVNANPVLNSAFQIWQRGVTGTANSASAGAGLNADRWQNYSNGNALTISRQLTNDTTNLPNIQYCARVQRNAGQTSLNGVFHLQNFESINAIPYAGKTVTFSFYARKGANYSEATSALGALTITGTGTDQNVLGAYTGYANTINVNAILTTTWQRFTGTAVIPAATKEFAIQFGYTPTGTAGAADYFEVTGVMLEVGSVATPFKTYAGTIQEELAACQRYYYRFGGDVTYQTLGFGTANATTTAAIMVTNPVPMRIAPTSVDFSTLALQTQATGTVNALTTLSIAVNQNGKNAVILNAGGSGGLTAGNPQVLLTNNSTSGYLGLSAEL